MQRVRCLRADLIEKTHTSPLFLSKDRDIITSASFFYKKMDEYVSNFKIIMHQAKNKLDVCLIGYEMLFFTKKHVLKNS